MTDLDKELKSVNPEELAAKRITEIIIIIFFLFRNHKCNSR